MEINILIQTVSTSRMHPIGNSDVEYQFRIEIWKQQENLQFFATVERSFYCDLHVPSENSISTEMIRSTEELLEIEEELFDNEQLAMENALAKLRNYYSPF